MSYWHCMHWDNTFGISACEPYRWWRQKWSFTLDELSAHSLDWRCISGRPTVSSWSETPAYTNLKEMMNPEIPLGATPKHCFKGTLLSWAKTLMEIQPSSNKGTLTATICFLAEYFVHRNSFISHNCFQTFATKCPIVSSLINLWGNLK